jgi:cytochrome b6-f complex iron-sulfur subunit
VDRRRALQLLLGSSTLGAAAALGVPVVRYLTPLPLSDAERSVSLDPEELSPGEGRLLVVGGLPAIVVNTGEGWSALSAVCTHLGCIVKWKKARRQFFCPCHGGRFDVDGRVLGGPAPRPLAKLEVQELPGRIVVRAV